MKAPPPLLCSTLSPSGIDDAEASATLAAFLSSSIDCVKILRPDGTLAQMNVAGISAMELPNFDAVNGRMWFDLWPEESRDHVRSAFDAAATKGVGRYEGFCPTARGTPKWWDVVVTPVRDASGRVVKLLSVSRDVTERVRRDLELKAARRAAEDANSAKTRFLANMSHEIRSPLAAILGYCELLEPGNEDDRDKLDTIRRNGKYLLNLVSDVIDLSRIEAGKVALESVKFSPVELVEEVQSLLSVKAAESQSELEVSVEGPVPKAIEADPLRTRQVLINLVSNALKFTDRGRVTVALSYCANREQLVFEVRDTGIGMSEEVLSEVFRPFTQADVSTSRRYGGSGLGLSISHELAEVMGAELTAESEVGVGTTFRFALPIPVADVTIVAFDRSPELKHPSVDPKTQLSIRVLVVDDRPDMRFITKMLIKSVGGRVELAESGLQAIERLEDDSAFDAVVMDVQMPELDGIEATRRLRRNGFALPIIAMTANVMSEDRQECLNAGYSDYLTKPIDFSELIASLRNATAA